MVDTRTLSAAKRRNYSPKLVMTLDLHGRRFNVAETGPDFLVVRDAEDVPAGVGVLHVAIDDDVRSTPIDLTDGIRVDREDQPTRRSGGYSAPLIITFRAGGRSYDVSSTGPNFITLRDADWSDATQGILKFNVGGRVDVEAVLLPDGIRPNRRRQVVLSAAPRDAADVGRPVFRAAASTSVSEG